MTLEAKVVRDAERRERELLLITLEKVREEEREEMREVEREKGRVRVNVVREGHEPKGRKSEIVKRGLSFTLSLLSFSHALFSLSLLHVNVRERVRERLPISISRQSSRLFFIFRSQCVMAATQFSIQWKSNFSSLLISRVDRLDRTEIDCSDNFQVPFGSDRSDQIG